MRAEYKKLFSEEAGLSHMHLKDGDEIIKALSVYKEFRVGRCNFVELKCVHWELSQGYEVHLFRLLKTHLGRMRFCYVLFQAHED